MTKDNNMNGKLLATIGTLIGIVVGSVGMWLTLKDRMENRIKEEVTRNLTIEIRIARLEEQMKAIKSDVTIIKTDSK
jgi:sensor domain CHASE-containing protein